MATFKNKSNQVFQDGDLMVMPGESFSTDEEFRAEQMRVQYAWQFEELSEKKSKDAPSEDEIKEEKPAASVRELRNGDHVKVEADGTQSKKVGE